MHPKRKAREYALQVLFLWDANGSPDAEIAERAMRSGTVLESAGLPAAVSMLRIEGVEETGPEPEARADALAMAKGAWDDRDGIDKRLEFHAPQWPPKRQPMVDRAILRLAVWELTHTKTPPKVAIDEAIELAKMFSTENSPSFVNGVLDAIHRENQALMAGVTGLPPAAP